MGKTAKITVEFDGKKSVFMADNVEITQSRDVRRKHQHTGGSKDVTFEKGQSVLLIQSVEAQLVPDECVPVPTIESAFGLEKMAEAGPDAEAIQESRREMTKKECVDLGFIIKEPVPSLRHLPEHPEDHEARHVQAHWPMLFVYTIGHGWEPLDEHVKRENAVPKAGTPRLFLCSYESDMKKFCKLVEEKGGVVEGVVGIPFRNYLGQENSRQFGIIYAYEEELEMEVLC